MAEAAPLNNALRAQLDGQFDKADRDKDGHLDAAELAKVFRGPNAKPIDHPASDQPGKASRPETPCPDHLFLAEHDKDGDGRISRAEYGKYEQKVAV